MILAYRAAMRTSLAIALLVLGVTNGCGSKSTDDRQPEPKPDKPGSGSSATGSATGSSAKSELPPPGRASQDPQRALPKLELPADPKRAEKIALGNALFFDKRLSGSKDRACYSCHMNENGTGGADPIAIGSGNKKLTRHAPTLWNVGYWKGAFYWDGRAKTLEDNIKAAWGGGNMAGARAGAKPEETTTDLDKRVSDLAKIPGYKKLFDAAFPKAPPKAEHAVAAMAEYLRTAVCDQTAYDKFVGGDKSALSEPQQRGFDVFMGKGKCNICHAPPFFTSSAEMDGGIYFNVGIGTKDVPEDKVDIGRKKLTNKDEDWAAFRPPSLRNVTKTAPYFHDGSVDKLEDAVKLMASGGIPNKAKNVLATDAQLTDAERADIISFLGALECTGKLEAPKKLP